MGGNKIKKDPDWNYFGKLCRFEEKGKILFIVNAENEERMMSRAHPDGKYQTVKANANKYKGKCVELKVSHGYPPEKWFCDIRPCNSESCDGESCDC